MYIHAHTYTYDLKIFNLRLFIINQMILSSKKGSNNENNETY